MRRMRCSLQSLKLPNELKPTQKDKYKYKTPEVPESIQGGSVPAPGVVTVVPCLIGDSTKVCLIV